MKREERYWELVEKGNWETLTSKEKTFVESEFSKQEFEEDVAFINRYSSKVVELTTTSNRAQLLAYAGKTTNSKVVYTLLTGVAAGVAIMLLLNGWTMNTGIELPDFKTVAVHDTVVVEKKIYDTIYTEKIKYIATTSKDNTTKRIQSLQLPEVTEYAEIPRQQLQLNEAVLENKGQSGFISLPYNSYMMEGNLMQK